jgi:hypothetical protein
MRYLQRKVRALLALLARLVDNARGYCYAGTAKLAEMFGCSERTMYRWLDRMEKMGLIAIKIVGRARRIFVLRPDHQMSFDFDAFCQSECQSVCQLECQSSIPAKPAARQELPPNSAPDIRDSGDLRDFSTPPAPPSGGSRTNENDFRTSRRRRLTRRERRRESMRAALDELIAAGKIAPREGTAA